MKKIMLVLLAGLLVMGLAACQEKEPPVSGGDLTDEPGKVRIFNEGGDQVHSSGARYVRVDGELYTDTGEIITLARCGVMDGEITKTVAETEPVEEDDCSNFGTGYQYQIAGVFRRDELERFRPSPNLRANAGKYPHSHPYPLRFSG